jgi:septum formation topological specificity factor MinE
MFNKEREEPTAVTADDRLSLVLSYQRSDIDEKKLKLFQTKLIELCDDFGYDVVGQVTVVPQAKERTTIINASIPVRPKNAAKEKE